MIYYNSLYGTMKQMYNIWNDSLEHTKLYMYISILYFIYFKLYVLLRINWDAKEETIENVKNCLGTWLLLQDNLPDAEPSHVKVYPLGGFNRFYADNTKDKLTKK